MADIREIVLDTETTGFEPSEGHRLVEIGCVELLNHLPTGNHFHVYLNPQRDVPSDAVRIHGLTTEFLQDKPLFTEKVGDFLDFIGDATLVIHNAEFDMKFINAEMKLAGFPKPLPMSRVIDTLLIARQKFPGQPANLDALCRRFKIDNTERKLHGALLDSELLAEVYLELMGGRQHGLGLASEAVSLTSAQLNASIKRQDRPPRSFPPSADETAAHEKFLEKVKDNLWHAEKKAEG
jgi:DNA polymerase-3 subunit epsilon